MINSILINLLGILIFFFLYWRRLKEDYISPVIFTSLSIILVLGMMAYFLANKFLPNWWFWTTITAFFVGLVVSVKYLKLHFYETLEVTIVSLFPWLFIVFLFDAVKNRSWISFSAAIIIPIFLFIYNQLNLRYKDFGWYRSGRIGFAGLTTLGIFFLIRGTIAIFLPFVLSFAGKMEPIASGSAAFLLFLGVFDLSRKL